MTACKQTFAQSAALKEPTDTDISALLGGVPIVSFHPDDLPDFKKSEQDYSRKDKATRAAALCDFLKSKYGFPVLLPDTDDAFQIANTNHACAIQLYQPISDTQAYAIYMIRRPPKGLSANEEMALRLNMNEQHIENPIPSEVLRYIIIHHEIRHLQQLINGKRFSADLSGDFNKEADADGFALSKLEEAMPQSIYTEPFIHLRALSGIFYTYPEYWLAPHLSHTFIKRADGPAPDAIDIRNSYTDILLRLAILAQNQIDLENGRGSKTYSAEQVQRANQVILDIPSRVFKEALGHFENDHPERIANIAYPRPIILSVVRNICETLHLVTESSGFKELRKDGTLLKIAKQIYDKGNIDSFTRENLKQILQAANHFCPTLSASLGCQID